MLLQFQTADDSIFIADVQFMNWARVSHVPNPNKPDESIVLESGKLVPQGFGIYALQGRTPKTEGPGAGLSTIGNYVVAIGNAVKIFLRANVDIKNFTMPSPIRQVLYEVLPTDPNQVAAAIQEVANVGEEKPQSPGSQEPEVAGSVPEGTAGEEQPQTEANVEPRTETLGEDSVILPEELQ